MERDLEARVKVRQVVDSWVLCRDAGLWEELARLWHDDGWMAATTFEGHFGEFIEACRIGFDRGLQVSHFLGGWTCELSGTRAVSQAKMKLEQRATVDGVQVDVTCTGRFYDFFEERDGSWAIVRRQPIYEKDRLDVVDPSLTLTMDQGRLRSFPDGYRHLGYVQESLGQIVARDLPGARGPELELLYGQGRAWLDGAPGPGRLPRADSRG